jgi:predicted restriction endonuclease
MWDEFRANIDVLGPESEQLLHDLFTHDDDQEVDFLRRDGVHLDSSLVRQATFAGATEGVASVKVRRGQQFFRQSVLNAYGVQCCVSGLNVPELLIASHIRPWASSPDTRLDPSNGLCLSRLHDGAFDLGLITLDERYRLVLSRRLKEHLPQDSIRDNFVRYEGRSVTMPKLIALPDQRHLSYHREHVFVD